MTDLMELASRVEAGEGPDREADVLIALSQTDRFFNAGPKYPGAGDRIGEIVGGDRCVPGNGAPDWLVPRYTASLDAAMSLVPPHLRLMLSEWDDEEHLRSKGPWQAVLSKPGQDASFDAMRGYRCEHAATPALALTAAALRARAHQGTAHVEQ